MPYAQVEVRMPRRTARGVTLVELLIVVAMIGVLSAVAILGYRRYVHSAQSAEARVVMGMIRTGEESYRQDTNSYLGCSGTLATYYPNTAPDDTRTVWEQPTDTRYTGCWRQLGVHPDAPVRYGYAVMAGLFPTAPGPLDGAFAHPPVWPTGFATGTQWYVVAAKNVHQNGMGPSLAVTTSWDSRVYAEGDGN
jgi:type IV pilus assembly protein PilA